MSLDPKWGDIYATKQRLILPGVPPKSRPIPPTGATCKEHCSRRHEHDGWLTCRKCGGRAYRVILHEYAHQPGHYFTGLVPESGAPEFIPARTPTCCGETMIRVFKA